MNLTNYKDYFLGNRSDIIYNITVPEFKGERVSANIFAVIAFFISFIFIAGLVENSFSLYVFARTKKLHNTNNLFIVGLVISDWSQSVFGIPLVVVSSVARGWLFGSQLCVYYGFVTTFLGITQITTLTAIALEKYFVIVGQNQRAMMNKKHAVYVITVCFLHGFIWALFPILGWSSYQLEGVNVSCSIRWESKESNDTSYCLSLYVFGWIIPLATIIFAYCSICRLLWKEAKKPARRNLKTTGRKKRMNREKSVAITVLLMIGAFVASWMPYSVVALIAVFADPKKIPLSVTAIPALFAKSSIIWNPIIYVARHNEFRKACCKLLPSCGKKPRLEWSGTSNEQTSSRPTTELSNIDRIRTTSRLLKQYVRLKRMHQRKEKDNSSQTKKYNSSDSAVNSSPKSRKLLSSPSTSSSKREVFIQINRGSQDNSDDEVNYEHQLETSKEIEDKICENKSDSYKHILYYKDRSFSRHSSSAHDKAQLPSPLHCIMVSNFCSQAPIDKNSAGPP